MPEESIDPRFQAFYDKFALEHPLFMPNETDLLVLRLFWLHGLNVGVNEANNFLKEVLDETDDSDNKSSES